MKFKRGKIELFHQITVVKRLTRICPHCAARARVLTDGTDLKMTW